MDLQNLERMCERLYNALDPGERAAAEQALLCFSTNTEYITHCQQILDESQVSSVARGVIVAGTRRRPRVELSHLPPYMLLSL